MSNKYDADSENNIENYGNRVSFTNFIVPESAEVTVVEVSWKDAHDFATEEMTDEDMELLGLNTDY